MPLTTYTAGEVLTAASLNANLSFAATHGASNIAIFNESQASGTDGGTFTSGSFVKRTLNTTVVNQITGCTLTSSVISLPAGSYQVFATAPAFKVNGHKIQLRNTTAGTTIDQGSSEFSDSSANDATSRSQIQTFFTLTTTSNIELQHRCVTTEVNDGFGTSSGFAVSEVYSQIIITKVA